MRRFLFVITSMVCFSAIAEKSSSVKHYSAEETANYLRTHEEAIILDVRTEGEFKQGHIELAKNIDFYAKEFKTKLTKLDKNRPYVLYCRSGRRSAKTLELMKELSFNQVVHLEKGILEWQSQKYPLVKEQYDSR